MTTVDIGIVGGGHRPRARSASLIADIETHLGFSELAAQWGALQLRGLSTPYQMLPWIKAWTESIADNSGVRPLLVAGRDGRGRLVLLLPLGIRKTGGVTIVEFLGGKHANFNMGLYDKTAVPTLSAADMKALLKAVADRHRIDLFSFSNQPLTWEGNRNPMAFFRHTRSADSVWKGALGRDPEKLFHETLSADRRKKLRAKERKLMELGHITYSEAKAPNEVDQALTAFFVQKRDRFSQLGIADPFAEPCVKAFLRTATSLRQGESRSPISLFVMKADERVLAVFGGIIHRGRFTAMFTAFDGDPAVARHSPGELLLMNLVRMMCEQGLDTFDLGMGDAAYKTVYCDVEEPLFDTLLPMSLTGHAAAVAIGVGLATKRRIKSSDRAMALVSRGRRLLRG
jgi:CelD/BcsL family acetyltransferase involved in cellulose biosynthesis